MKMSRCQDLGTLLELTGYSLLQSIAQREISSLNLVSDRLDREAIIVR